MTDPAVLASIPPSPPRRVFGLVILGGLASFLLWIAAFHPPQGAGWMAFVLVAGGGTLWIALRFWTATAVTLELTAEELREAGGRRLVAVADIRAVRRGAFAIKPANGFVLDIAASAGRVWAPGVWWRSRRRLGVGGATPRHQTRAMAEAIARRLERG